MPAPQWKRQPSPCPPPGVYEGVDSDTYHAWDAVNASMLKQAGLDRGTRSWAKVHHYLTGPLELSGGHMYLGRAWHAALLEPEDYAARAVVLDSVVRPSTGKENKLSESAAPEVWAAAQNQCPGCYVLSDDMAATVRGMTDTARRHERVKTLLGLESRRELSLVWDDEETGLRCKCRLDWWIDGGAERGTVVDLKSTRDARPWSFNRDVERLGYFFSLAFYGEGVRRHLSSIAPNFVLIAQEKEAPFDLRIYELHSLYIELGRVLFRDMLHQFARCYIAGAWTGYPSETLDLVPSPHLLAGYPEITQ